MSRPVRTEPGGHWSRLHERLERVRDLAASSEHRTPEAERAILAARAHALAQPLSSGGPVDATAMVLIRLGDERFALPADAVREVFRVTELALLPGAAPPLVAVTVHRGELLMLIDIRRPRIGVTPALEGASVVAIQAGGERSGMLVDEIIGVELLAADAIHVPRGESRAHVRGVTDDAVTVLEPGALTRATT